MGNVSDTGMWGSGEAIRLLGGGHARLFDKMQILKISNLVPRGTEFCNPLSEEFIFYSKWITSGSFAALFEKIFITSKDKSFFPLVE